VVNYCGKDVNTFQLTDNNVDMFPKITKISNR